MLLNYTHLRRYPKVFKQLTGLDLAEFDVLLDRVLELHDAYRYERLKRDNRQRDFGGGDKSNLDVCHQLLATVMWLRLYWTHDLLAFFFGVSQPTISRYVSHMLPILEKHELDTMRSPIVSRKKRLSQLSQAMASVPELQIVIDSFTPHPSPP